MDHKTAVPAAPGWFSTSDGPRLLGSRCASCGSYAFPRATYFCRNPYCDGTQLEETPLSSRGRIWSYTVNHYQPPPPYVSPTEKFQPFGVAAVELIDERMVVMGQLVAGAVVAVGDEVELVIDTLYSDEEHEYLIWKWQPVGDIG